MGREWTSLKRVSQTTLTQHIPRPGPRRPGPVVLVIEVAALQAEAAAADAFFQLGAGAGEELDLGVKLDPHRTADPLPV